MSQHAGPRDGSLVARVLAHGFARLRFPEPLETEFRADHLGAVRRWVRLAIVVAAGTTAGFAIIDHWAIRASNAVPDLVRFGLQMPILVAAVLATFDRFYARWYQKTVQVGSVLFGLGTVLMASYAPPEHAAMVAGRVLLFTFFVYFMLGLRMGQALRCNMVVLLALLAAGLLGMMPSDVATYMGFALVCANVIGSAGAYALEHASRTSFLERRLLVEIATLDGLTRLLNRQTFETRVHEAWRCALLEQQPITVIMVDVDHFKLYNDHYGHQAGDECLRRVATTVRAAVGAGSGDFVARYGGEEIIAVLIGRSAADASAIAQRIVEHVAALDIAHALADCRRVSVSVGAATETPPIASSFDALVRLADDALYAAKREGRNRSVVVESRPAVAA
ncbi:MAG: hypothetical protein DIU71_00380 [Proteobacteria bacterium]|nr:MAG: hypothetical protein DIU71_00380 [Pseudomonadota bacterium]